eukprot:scaffold104909_cov33-Phaeocystis_antarctica.AAC.1
MVSPSSRTWLGEVGSGEWKLAGLAVLQCSAAVLQCCRNELSQRCRAQLAAVGAASRRTRCAGQGQGQAAHLVLQPLECLVPHVVHLVPHVVHLEPHAQDVAPGAPLPPAARVPLDGAGGPPGEGWA